MDPSGKDKKHFSPKKELSEKQRQLETLMDNLPGIAYRCLNDMNWTMKFLSTGCFELTGYKPEELMDNTRVSYGDIIHPNDQKMVWDEIQKNIRHNRPFKITYRIITASGEEKWVWEQGRGIRNKKQELLALEGFITDITSKVMAEAEIQRQKKALVASEEKFRSFVQQASEGIYLLGFQAPIPIALPLDEQVRKIYEGTMTECNNSLAKMYGYSTPNELKGMRLSDFHGSTNNPQNIKTIRSFVKSGYHVVNKITIEIDKQGNKIWFSNNVIGMVEQGYLKRVWGTQTNITELKQTELALQQSIHELTSLNKLGKQVSANLSLKQVIKSSIKGINHLIKTDLVVVFIEKGNQMMFHQSEKIKPLNKQKLKAQLEECLYDLTVNGKSSIYSIDLNLASGRSYPVYAETGMASFATLPLRGGEEIIGVLGMASIEERDFSKQKTFLETAANEISIAIQNTLLYSQLIERANQLEQEIHERKKVEEALQQHQEELEQRVEDRTLELKILNEDLKAFVHSVSHDLRAPLRHIDGFLNLLKSQLPDMGKEAQRFLNKTINATNTMSMMIEELLNFARIGRKDLQKNRIDLNQLVIKSIHHFEPDIIHRDIDWDIGQLPLVEGDQKLLQLAIDNLIENAIKFTQKKKKAKIEIKSCGTKEDCSFYIKDNGAGFDNKYTHQLFKVFQRLHTEDEFKGIGIGLANVYQIIKKHGGLINAKGTPGKGATFFISL